MDDFQLAFLSEDLGVGVELFDPRPNDTKTGDRGPFGTRGLRGQGHAGGPIEQVHPARDRDDGARRRRNGKVGLLPFVIVSSRRTDGATA